MSDTRMIIERACESYAVMNGGFHTVCISEPDLNCEPEQPNWTRASYDRLINGPAYAGVRFLANKSRGIEPCMGVVEDCHVCAIEITVVAYGKFSILSSLTCVDSRFQPIVVRVAICFYRPCFYRPSLQVYPHQTLRNLHTRYIFK